MSGRAVRIPPLDQDNKSQTRHLENLRLSTYIIHRRIAPWAPSMALHTTVSIPTIRGVISGWGSCVFSEASVCNNSIRVVVFIELVDLGVLKDLIGELDFVLQLRNRRKGYDNHSSLEWGVAHRSIHTERHICKPTVYGIQTWLVLRNFDDPRFT